MFCSRMGNGIPITCTTTYQKWTGQPIYLAGSKNPLSSDMGSVKESADKTGTITNDVKTTRYMDVYVEDNGSGKLSVKGYVLRI